MAAHYSFRNILDIDPENKSFTCAGTNEPHEPSQRCQNPILVEDREAASRILDKMDMSSTCEETLQLLPELVSRTLCTEIHRSKPELCQVGQVYTEWRDIVKRESSKRSFERWRLRKVRDTLESMKVAIEDEKENDNISPFDLVSPFDPLLYSIKRFSQENEYTTNPLGEEPVLDEKRNTFGNCPDVSRIFGSTRDSYSQEARLSALIAELPAPPRRRTWPDDEHKIARKPLPPGFRNSTATHPIKKEEAVEVTALSDPIPPGSPTIEVHIAPEEPTVKVSPQSSTPDIPPRSPLRAPCLEHLSFVSSISCLSRETLPSTRQITPPVLDQYSSHSQGTADMTPPLPSPTPQSPHAIPWFLREEFSVPAPDLPSELPSRRGSGFRTSAVLEVDVEAEVCGVCRLARGEDSCTCNWGDLMFTSESDSVSSGSVASRRSDVKIGCFRSFGNRVKGSVGTIRRRVFGVVRPKRGSKSDEKEWIVYRWRSAA